MSEKFKTWAVIIFLGILVGGVFYFTSATAASTYREVFDPPCGVWFHERSLPPGTTVELVTSCGRCPNRAGATVTIDPFGQLMDVFYVNSTKHRINAPHTMKWVCGGFFSVGNPNSVTVRFRVATKK